MHPVPEMSNCTPATFVLILTCAVRRINVAVTLFGAFIVTTIPFVVVLTSPDQFKN